MHIFVDTFFKRIYRLVYTKVLCLLQIMDLRAFVCVVLLLLLTLAGSSGFQQSRNLPLRAKQEPVIFEPRPSLQTTAATYRMIVMYDMKGASDFIGGLGENAQVLNAAFENVYSPANATSGLDKQVVARKLLLQARYSTLISDLQAALHGIHDPNTEDAKVFREFDLSEEFKQELQTPLPTPRTRRKRQTGTSKRTSINLTQPTPNRPETHKPTTQTPQSPLVTDEPNEKMKHIVPLNPAAPAGPGYQMVADIWPPQVNYSDAQPVRRNKRSTDLYGFINDSQPLEDHVALPGDLLALDSAIKVLTRGMTEQVRKKRGLFELIGLGVGFMNRHDIGKNRAEIRSLQANLKVVRQNQQLFDQQIQHLGHYLNVTMIHFRNVAKRTEELSYFTQKLATNLANFQEKVREGLSYLRYMLKIHMLVNNVNEYLDRIDLELHFIEHVMEAVRTGALNAEMMGPREFSSRLEGIENKLKMQNSKFHLPRGWRSNIWHMYSIVEVRPLLVEGFLFLICDIPLYDDDLRLDVYQIHVLPIVKPELGVLARYQLDKTYVAITRNAKFMGLPSDHEIQACEKTAGRVCHFKTALIPVDECHACECWLFKSLRLNVSDALQTNCRVKLQNATAPNAENLHENLWCITVPSPRELFENCEKSMKTHEIKPPMTLLKLGNGCSGHMSGLFLPAQTFISQNPVLSDRWAFFKRFNHILENQGDMEMWKRIGLDKLERLKIPEWKESLTQGMPEALPMGRLNERMKEFHVREIGPLKPWVKWLIGAVILLFVILLIGLVAYWYYTGRLASLRHFGFKAASKVPAKKRPLPTAKYTNASFVPEVEEVLDIQNTPDTVSTEDEGSLASQIANATSTMLIETLEKQRQERKFQKYVKDRGLPPIPSEQEVRASP